MPVLPVVQMLHFRWDLDKTYIHTEFDSVRDLVRTFRQTAEEKQAVAGAPTLLRELLEPSAADDSRRVTFISGSPRQMRRVLTDKLRLDGIEPDAFVLKPNLSNLLKLRLRALNDQVAYKLAALLGSTFGGADVREILFGDDAEADALIYSLYADVLAGVVDRSTLARSVEATSAYRSDIAHVLALHDALGPDRPVVDRIFIHLDRRSPTSRFDAFGTRVVPVYNYFQVAVLLFDRDLLAAPALLRVVESMGHAGYTPTRLANSMQDLERRGFLPEALLARTRDVFARADQVLGRPTPLLLGDLADALDQVEASGEERPWVGEIDYVAACAEVRRYRRKRDALRNVGALWRERSG